MPRLADSAVPLPADVQLPERYELRRPIASGGMASVWCATDRVLGRDVAIKLLAEQFAHDQAAIRRFKREARAAARLSGHPHVVTIFDVADTGEDLDGGRRAFIVMEYLAGGTVADALRVGAVNRPQAIRWLHEAAVALDYAHGRGVVHRDIKPANFLLDCDKVLHVADFGIARLGTEDTVTSAGEVLGTAAYLAPERVLGRPATEASDRYSLAVAAFELLTGERPFKAEHFAALARQHVDAPVPPASERDRSLPRAVEAVLSRGMAKRPEDRWPTAAAMIDTLDLALTERAGQRTVAMTGRRTAALAPPPLGLLRSPARAARVPRRGAALGALAAAALGVGIAVGASQDSGMPKARISAGTNHAVARKPAPTHITLPKKHKHAVHHAAPTVTGSQAAATTAPPTVTGSQAAATTAPQTADTLEARGHQLMVAGNYAAAIPVLRQAVAAADPSGLTYAYALFDLGHSLRMAGDPRAAIPILYKRLQIPNQTDVVRTELQAALRAVGAQVQASGDGAPVPPSGPPGHAKGKHRGHGGGG
jgi:eukaryotic-like serine/threonine-protein kinase